MKRAMMPVITVLLPGFGSASAATDYSGCSDEKLNGVRGTLYNEPLEVWNAFGNEWQKRKEGPGPMVQMQCMRPQKKYRTAGPT